MHVYSMNQFVRQPSSTALDCIIIFVEDMVVIPCFTLGAQIQPPPPLFFLNKGECFFALFLAPYWNPMLYMESQRKW